MVIQPLGKRVLIEQELPDEVTPGGIIIPDVAQVPTGKGVVLATGPDVEYVRRGDVVYFAKFVGVKIKLEGDTPREYELSKHIVVHEDDLLGIEIDEESWQERLSRRRG